MSHLWDVTHKRLQHNLYWRKVMPDIIIQKACSKCKQIKPVSEFYKWQRAKDGHHAACKMCYKIYSKSPKAQATRKRHRQSKKYKITTKRYSRSESFKMSQRRYLQTEKGKIASRGKTRRYRCRYPERVKISRQKFCHSEKGKILGRRCRARYPERTKARMAIGNAVIAGKLPNPKTLQCYYCNNQAQQYHHWHGYKPEYWFDVVPACRLCDIKDHQSIPITTEGFSPTLKQGEPLCKVKSLPFTIP